MHDEKNDKKSDENIAGPAGGRADTSLTSARVRAALEGDDVQLEFTILHLSPLLECQARYDLGSGLRHIADPKDLVNTVWERALPRLHTLEVEDGRYAKAVLGYLSRILHRLVVDLVRQSVRRRRAAQAARDDGFDVDEAPEGIVADTTSVFSRLARASEYDVVTKVLDDLAEPDREVVVLRAIKGVTNREAAVVLGLPENTVAQRYSRALGRLRARLPRSIFDEIDG